MNPPETSQDINVIRLAARRLRSEWRLMSSIFTGIMIATLLMAAAPVYLDALERQSIQNAVDISVDREGDTFFDVTVYSDFIPLEAEEIAAASDAQTRAVTDNIGPIYTGTDLHLRTSYYSVTVPPRAALARAEAEDDPDVEFMPFAQGFAQHFTGLESNVAFVGGRPARDVVLRGPQGPMVEAVLSARTAEAFGALRTGDVLVVAPSLDSPLKVSARITGLVEAADPDSSYWRGDVDSFLFPRMPNEDGDVTPSSPPLLGMFVGERALSEAIGAAFPGATVDAVWHNGVEPTILRTWSRGEMRSRMDGLDEDMSILLPESFVANGIEIMLARFGRETFLTSVPLLLLMAVLGVSVLYFLFMIVSYLAPARESDVALFRSRGTGTWRLFRLYLSEGFILTVIAAAAAPFLALAAVSLVGLLPYFRHITDGGPLPVHASWLPFAAAAIAGGLCLAIFVIPGTLGARAGLIIHRLRASRPPSVPIIQRYYIDILFLIIAGALYWELQARGELVSGGLFGQQDVNEALLIAPALFLLTLGMLFFRIFPMFIRYISGESLALVHLAAGASLAALVPAVLITDIRAGYTTAWIPSIAALGGFAAAYWFAARSSGRVGVAAWTAAQVVLSVAFVYLRQHNPNAPAVLFAAAALLVALAPAQGLFYLIGVLVRRAPVWVSMSLWHMARNPLQYAWLTLLLLLVSGTGILATTVGATLDRSYEERIRYSVATDVRVSGLDSYLGRRDGRVEDTYGKIPGVESVSPALRSGGRIGATEIGPGFSYLAVDTRDFDPWHREDFAHGPPSEILPILRSEDVIRPMPIPEDANRLRIWANPEGYYPLIFLWVVVQDANGRTDTISMGAMESQDWNLMSAKLPDNLVRPLQLVSIQLNEPGYGATATAGQIVFDDLYAVDGRRGRVTLMEGFEGPPDWIPLTTSAIRSDEVARISDNVRSGSGALLFTFGKETNLNLRGFYRTGGSGYIPAIASRTLSEVTGAWKNSGLIVRMQGGLVPVVVRDVVDYFPTLDPLGGSGFLIFDLDTLAEYTDALNPRGAATTNEAFISVSAGSDARVQESVEDILRLRAEAAGVEERLEAQANDPLISAGWRAMVIVALAVILFISALGYVVYLLAFAETSVAEMASLRSLGFSRAQTIGLVCLEHLLIALIGLGVGAWAGFQMSGMIVSAVTVTDGGGRVLPPFILTTNWAFMGPLYAAMIAVFVIALLTLGRRVLTLDLRRLSRMEG